MRNKIAQLFLSIDEPFAAGFFEEPEADAATRFCRAYRRFYEACPPPAYDPEAPLYPTERMRIAGMAVNPQYCRQYGVDFAKLREKSEEAARVFAAFDEKHNRFLDVEGKEEVLRYTAAVDGWNHSTLHLPRILSEGLDRYEERVLAMRDNSLKMALYDVLIGIRDYHGRVLKYLKEIGAEKRLIEALEKVPFRPAQTAYEAMVAANFMLCFDEYDNIGYVDAWLPKYWHGEDLTREMRCMMQNLQLHDGWSITIGPEYSELTRQWLRAGEGLAKPMIELRTTQDMPEDLWNLALERVLSGGGQPSFYNEQAIMRRLKERLPEAPDEDIRQFAGMGCTETSLCGMSFSGGIDVNLNVLKVFEECMQQTLTESDSFEAFYARFMQRLHAAQDRLMAYMDAYYAERARMSFAPIRTLFTDDCIEKERGYFQGGARYTFAVPSDSGIPNTVDSLLAIKTLVFEQKRYTAAEFTDALQKQDAALFGRLNSCPSCGIGDPQADALLYDLTSRFYDHYRQGEFRFGTAIFPTSHQFVRHIPEGESVGSTPDGRRAGQPVSDSIAAANGKAVQGPTAMLLSAARHDQEQVYGIAVLNLSIAKRFPSSILRALIEGYFKANGTQMQITCTTKEDLLAAKADPERHRDLVVRVGGYSAYFCNLSDELQNAVIERTLFS